MMSKRSRWFGSDKLPQLRTRLADKGGQPADGSVEEDCKPVLDERDTRALDERDFIGKNRTAEGVDEGEGVVRVVDSFSKHLLGEIEHDLRTPLAALRMNVGLLLDHNIGTLNENQQSLATYAKRDVDRLILLLDLYIGLFNQPAEQVGHLETLDLLEMVKEALESVRIIGEIRKIDVSLEAPEEAPLLVRVDQQALERVLETLVLLAFKISRKKQEVLLRLEKQPQGAVLDIVISEPAPDATHIGNVFALPTVLDEQVEGIPYARRAMLRTCHKILSQMQGELEVCSYGDNKSGFKVKLAAGP